MKIKFLNAVICLLLLFIFNDAAAQQTYTEGTIVYTSKIRDIDADITAYFTPDSIASTFIVGPATTRIISDAQYQSFVVLVDVPVASIKKAAIMNPAEISQTLQALPVFTYNATSQTKQVSGFNCKKVIATDTSTKKMYDVWITNDVIVPPHIIPKYYSGIGGLPVEYIAFQTNQDGSLSTADVVIKSISDQKPPQAIFSIPPDFDKITMDELKAMSQSQ